MELLNPQFLGLVAQRPKCHAQELGGGGLVIAGLFQRLEDRIAFDVFELLPQRCAGRRIAGFATHCRQLEHIERDAIIKALEQTRYNKTAAAKLLGMTFRALRYRVKKLGIE